MTKEGPIDFKGTGMAVHAIQGMKPHFAGKAFLCIYQQHRN